VNDRVDEGDRRGVVRRDPVAPRLEGVRHGDRGHDPVTRAMWWTWVAIVAVSAVDLLVNLALALTRRDYSRFVVAWSVVCLALSPVMLRRFREPR
jgi:hypothetical protein